MLEKIKSSYIMKKIFSQLKDGKKLKLIKYNKFIQYRINISQKHFKKLTGKIIIYEKNKQGKEYDKDGELIYEGEFLNGERNGEGKEYDFDGEILYEGEYLKGKRNGKGKEYKNGLLFFEGEYLKGKKWNGKGFDKKKNIIYQLNNGNGKVKEYSHNGKIFFEGEYLNGERNGKVKEYMNGVLFFQGEYLHDKRNGKGKEFDSNKIFEGEYFNDERNLKENI